MARRFYGPPRARGLVNKKNYRGAAGEELRKVRFQRTEVEEKAELQLISGIHLYNIAAGVLQGARQRVWGLRIARNDRLFGGLELRSRSVSDKWSVTENGGYEKWG